MTILTQEQIDIYLRDGVLVVDNILTEDELAAARSGLHQTLRSHGVDPSNLPETAHNLQKLSSTNGSGGVLDIFYARFKMDIGSNEKLFGITKELWAAAYAHEGESEEHLIALGRQEAFHPFGKFDVHKGYMYIDRLGYRIPTKLAQDIGEKQNGIVTTSDENNVVRSGKGNNGSRKYTKKTAIQRSLTPHLDCCPDTFYSTDKSKWRPIQCFVSLTDNLEPNTGGFEAALGFHRKFHQWRKERAPSIVTKKMDQKSGMKIKQEVPAPCIGEYTHIRPVEDGDVIKCIRHIPVRAGSAVFWDNRIPHANSYRNDSNIPRAVVYCSFLPDVSVNRSYAERQLEDYMQFRKPRDTWIHVCDDVILDRNEAENYSFSKLGRKLMKMDEW